MDEIGENDQIMNREDHRGSWLRKMTEERRKGGKNRKTTQRNSTTSFILPNGGCSAACHSRAKEGRRSAASQPHSCEKGAMGERRDEMTRERVKGRQEDDQGRGQQMEIWHGGWAAATAAAEARQKEGTTEYNIDTTFQQPTAPPSYEQYDASQAQPGHHTNNTLPAEPSPASLIAPN